MTSQPADSTPRPVESNRLVEDLALVCDAYGLPHDAVGLARHIESNSELTLEVWKTTARLWEERAHAAEQALSDAGLPVPSPPTGRRGEARR